MSMYEDQDEDEQGTVMRLRLRAEHDQLNAKVADLNAIIAGFNADVAAGAIGEEELLSRASGISYLNALMSDRLDEFGEKVKRVAAALDVDLRDWTPDDETTA